MNGFLLLIPFLLIRFLLMFIINKEAIQRAAHFAPVQGNEKIAYYIYQILNVIMFIYLFFLSIKIDFSWVFYVGAICYVLGLCLCAISIVSFSSPNDTGMNKNGIYKISRNPMYVSYFVCFIGMALLTKSIMLLILVLVFQISAHWIIISEEWWCIEKFGTAYREYMKKVRRYF